LFIQPDFRRQMCTLPAKWSFTALYAPMGKMAEATSMI
jgi:hypothetical protein